LHVEGEEVEERQPASGVGEDEGCADGSHNRDDDTRWRGRRRLVEGTLVL
jgi:hypothetical protein